MTLDQLVAELEGFRREYGGNTPVHFSYNYGDYWKTQVAPVVRNVEPLHVEHSSYHDMDKVVDVEDVNEEEEKMRLVLVLQS